MFVTSVLLKALTCWPTCGNEESGPVAAAVADGATGSLWPMIALTGAAAVLVGLLQAFRRKIGTAILSLLCGGCLLGLVGMGVTSGRIRAPGAHHLTNVPVALGLRPATPLPGPAPPWRLPAWKTPQPEKVPVEAPVRVLVEGGESLAEALDELGTKFRKMSARELVRRLQEEDAVLGISEWHESEVEAEREALEKAAQRLREQLRDAVAAQTKLPIAEWLDGHAEELDQAITELIEGLPESDYFQMVTREFDSSEAREHRSVVRVDVEQAAHELRGRASEFFEEEVVPRSREAARAALSMFALGILVYLAFVFVDSGTRGHFTWTLRIAAAVAYVGMCGALWYFVP